MKLSSRILKRLGLKTAAWNEEFKTGYWDGSTESDPVYGIMRTYPGSVLELGCGSGATPYEMEIPVYCGVDISSTAIGKAKLRNPSARFITSSMESYSPDAKYDVILFRESIYYVKDIEGLLARLSPYLSHLGVFIVRIHDRRKHAEVVQLIVQARNVREALILPTGGIILVFK